MIAHWNITQGTEEWFLMKWGKIGGSTSKGLFVKSDTLLEQILSECMEPYEHTDDDYVSYEMQRGIELEPLARQKLSEYAGVKLLECGLLECEEIPLFNLSPDGITKDLKVAVEIKCPSRKKHIANLRNPEIDSDYIHQCLHNFTVNPNLEKLVFGSFRPECEHDLAVRILTRDSEINLGTKAKPVIKPIYEWVQTAKQLGRELMERKQQELNRLAF